MLYNLTEEQSTEFVDKLETAIQSIQYINKKSIDILNYWYSLYVKNHTSFLGLDPMPIKKFWRKIVIENGIQLYESDRDITFVTGIDGWSFSLRPKTIMKYTKLSLDDIVHDIIFIRGAAMSSALRRSEYDYWYDILIKMNTYMKVPFTIDDEWMNVLQCIDGNIEYYNSITEIDNDTKDTDS